MVVSSHSEIFLNKPVQNYILHADIQPEQFVYRLAVEDEDEGISISDVFDAFVQHPKAGEVQELIIGRYSSEWDGSSEEAVNKLVALNTVLTNLKAVFIGDITYDECEISWINQTEMAPVLAAYPNLEHLQVRGSNELNFSTLQHDQLKTLIIECGGLHPHLIEQVSKAQLPNLQRLDLWLGIEDYGFNLSSDEFLTTISGILAGTTFPKLTHLGLMDSEIQDEIAVAVSTAPVLQQLKVLDLSMGTLGDEGAAALLASQSISQLEHLNLKHHYMSEMMMQRIQNMGISVNADDREEGGEDDRYVEVSE